MKMQKRKGSIIVEAAVVIPFFIIVIMCMAFLIKIVYIHELINNTVFNMANEIASYSYLYTVSDFEQLNDDIKEADLFGFSDLVKGQAIDLGLKEYMKNRIDNGIAEKLDFSESSFLENGEDIEIVARYTINLPILNILPSFYMVEHTRVRAWLTGDLDIESDIEGNIWELSPLKRGMLISHYFREKLDDTTSEIISIDIRKPTYTQNPASIKSKIKFEVINSNADDFRRLIVVIPKNSSTDTAMSAINAGFVEGKEQRMINAELKIIEIDKLEELGGNYNETDS